MQHDRPDDRVEADDLLADEVDVRRPVLLKQRIVVRAVAQRVDVVGQRVHPDVNGVLRVKIDRNAPLERRAGDAQILQARNQEVVEHLCGAGRRLDEVRMRLDVVDQPVLILREAEEVAFLARLFHRASAVRTAAVLELKLRPEGLAGRTVPALVFALVDVALIVELLENLLYGLHVALVGRADEVVVLDVHQLPELLDAVHDMIDVRLRRHAGIARLALDLLPMLIRAGQEKHVVAGLLLEAGHGVRRGRAVAVADMQVVAGVVDWRCDVKLGFFAHISSLLQNTSPAGARDDRVVVPPCFAAHDAASTPGNGGHRRA